MSTIICSTLATLISFTTSSENGIVSSNIIPTPTRLIHLISPKKLKRTDDMFWWSWSKIFKFAMFFKHSTHLKISVGRVYVLESFVYVIDQQEFRGMQQHVKNIVINVSLYGCYTKNISDRVHSNVTTVKQTMFPVAVWFKTNLNSFDTTYSL